MITLEQIKQDFQKEWQGMHSLADMEKIKIAFLGKKGIIADQMKLLRDVPAADRAQRGQDLNRLKQEITDKITEQNNRFLEQEEEKLMDKQWLDISLESAYNLAGALHPVTHMRRKLEDVFLSMGFQLLKGNHVETEYYNFEALNIPKDHPARDMQDTFYLGENRLLRTHTSSIQIHGMKKLGAPLRVIGSGKVFRCERVDASHESCFHQLEGMLVDEDISLAHLKYFIDTYTKAVFGSNTKMRLRPAYFPFVEPGLELDLNCMLCGGKGCSACKQTGWIEVMGCGLVHPNVLQAGDVDSKKYSGFAFGIGVDRFAMMAYGIKDIRLLYNGGIPFIQSFA